MRKTVALVGNQNCGKTTLFNRLTGSNQHVGNFPGVTVERKSGAVRGQPALTVVDLPGVYSLAPYSAEERITRAFLLHERPDAVINVADATCLERSLYLTLQLRACGVPMVVALNMIDVAEKRGLRIDIAALSARLGVPVVAVSASRGVGLPGLLRAVQQARTCAPCPRELYGETIGKTLLRAAECVAAKDIPPYFAAVKLLEDDAEMRRAASLPKEEEAGLRAALPSDIPAALADLRYQWIERTLRACLSGGTARLPDARTARLDRWLTHRLLAIPLFAATIALVFYLTFAVVGGSVSDQLAAWLSRGAAWCENALAACGCAPWLRSLITDGVLTGVGSVLSFLPVIMTLFFCLSLFEDSGYMARVAFVMDRPLARIGLSGRSLVPMLLGFGCSVPAVMATRTLASARDRMLTIRMIPFMSCSAKLPIYAVFTATFFPRHAALVMTGLYLLGVTLGVLRAWLSGRGAGGSEPFVMELPEYRLPDLRSVLLHMWEKARDFLTRAFGLIFLASIAVWFLQRFNLHLQPAARGEDSLLAAAGELLVPLLRPLGFGDWRAGAALLCGLTAKEAVVATLAVLLGAGSLAQCFCPASALSFLVFTLLYMPCVAAAAAIRRELPGRFRAARLMLLQTGIAWVCAYVTYWIGRALLPGS